MQRALEKNDFDCLRVCFNAGDRIYSSTKDRFDFYGGAEEWQFWLESIVDTDRFDHIILFGCERPAHRIARKIARARGINLLSLEEGYIRPGFITVEQGGNNANSPLNGRLPPAEFESPDESTNRGRNFKSFLSLCRHGMAYYSVRALLSSPREHAMSHRRVSLLRDPGYWVRNYWRYLIHRHRDFSNIEQLLEHHHRRYFLVPLQVSADGQMGEASRGWNTNKLIAETLSGFATCAPKGYRLVFKTHPLERGHSNVRRFIKQSASTLGIEDKVDIIETGSLGLITRHSAGMITINSTSGLSAIFHGVPLMALGHALYSHPALATMVEGKPDFETFWNNGMVADSKLRHRYLDWILQRSLTPGDFYTKEGVELACKGVIDRLRTADQIEDAGDDHQEFPARNLDPKIVVLHGYIKGTARR